MIAQKLALTFGLCALGVTGCQQAGGPAPQTGSDAASTSDLGTSGVEYDTFGDTTGTQAAGLTECPAKIEGVETKVELQGNAVHLTFTGPEPQLQKLRNSAELLSEMIEGRVRLSADAEMPTTGGADAPGTQPGLEAPTDGRATGVDVGAQSVRVIRVSEDDPTARMGWGETPMILPQATARVEETDGGVRLAIEPQNPQHLSLIQTQLNQWMTRSRTVECPPLEAAQPGAGGGMQPPSIPGEMQQPTDPAVPPQGIQQPGMEPAPGLQPLPGAEQPGIQAPGTIQREPGAVPTPSPGTEPGAAPGSEPSPGATD